jgi:hypothetical protein
MSDAKQQPLFILGATVPEFWWTVQIPSPTDNDYAVAGLDLLFAPVEQPELDAMRGIGLAEGEAVPSDAQICRRVVRGWRKLCNEHGAEVPFSPEALDQLLRAPVVRTAIVVTYLAAMSGTAARKNA